MTTEGMNEVVMSQSAPNEGVASASNGIHSGNGEVDGNAEKKRTRTNSQDGDDSSVKRVKGVAPIKAECAATANM